MEPFSVPESLRGHVDPHLSPEFVLDAAGRGGDSARTALARLWLSEGIPHAFRECPAVYESVRSWLSAFLSVHAKEITIVGSARLGASHSPKKLGKEFTTDSDLDLAVISSELFKKLREEFFQWLQAFERGEVHATNPREARFWHQNSKRVPRNIEAGFIDARYIPNHEPYRTARTINDTMSLLVKKLNRTPRSPSPCKAGVRCYKSWDSFVIQKSRNLKHCWEEWKKQAN